MHLWKTSNHNLSSSSSSSSPKSSPSSPSKQRRVFSHLFNRREPKPRLTRQRRLRHVDDIAVLGPSASANSTPLSQSPSPRRDCVGARSMSAVPVPLPLPDSFFRRAGSGLSSSSNSCNFPLPSPKEPDVDFGDLVLGDAAVPERSSIARFSHQNFFKNGEHVDTMAGSTSEYGKKVFHDHQNVNKIRDNYRLSVPAKSAPASGLSSPVLSPRRLSTGDFFPPAYMSSQGQLQFWSDPVFPSSDMTFSAQASPEKFMASPERSPLHSPRTRTPAPRTPSGAATPLHPKLSSENSSAWHDNNGVVTVHPLPLPPGAAFPSQPALLHQPTAKPESSSMKSQWQKGKLIGSGTFGNVYVASNRETGALCAMKEVNIIPDDAKSIECVKQLEQEIKILSQLKHPNIVQYYGSEIVEDCFYIYLEYVHPGSISKYVREHCGAMTESVVRNFTRHILSGLAYLHSTNTIHRDIKGANLLVDSSGVVKLADFGMAKHLSGHMMALSLKGSPHWMAPEVMHASMMQKDAGHYPAIDIWSLGCTIIEMFTGKPPWSEYEGAAAMFKVLKNESPPTPETLSADGKNFLQCCLQKNPADRPSASELLDHPFVKYSHNHEIHGCIEVISQMKLKDMAHSPRRSSSTQSSLGSQASKRKQVSNCETGRSYAETSECAGAPRHSPRSTLEAISSLSPPRSNHNTHYATSPSHAPNGKHVGTGNCSHHTWM